MLYPLTGGPQSSRADVVYRERGVVAQRTQMKCRHDWTVIPALELITIGRIPFNSPGKFGQMAGDSWDIAVHYLVLRSTN